jgi:hypothetical protein
MGLHPARLAPRSQGAEFQIEAVTPRGPTPGRAHALAIVRVDDLDRVMRQRLLRGATRDGEPGRIRMVMTPVASVSRMPIGADSASNRNRWSIRCRASRRRSSASACRRSRRSVMVEIR